MTVSSGGSTGTCSRTSGAHRRSMAAGSTGLLDSHTCRNRPFLTVTTYFMNRVRSLLLGRRTWPLGHVGCIAHSTLAVHRCVHSQLGISTQPSFPNTFDFGHEGLHTLLTAGSAPKFRTRYSYCHCTAQDSVVNVGHHTEPIACAACLLH